MHNNTIKTNLSIILVLLFSLVFSNVLISAPPVKAASVVHDLPGWQHRYDLVVHNTGNALNDYQVQIQLDNNFPFEAASSDGSDVRVTDLADNMLPFWIESWSPATTSASIWVRMPTLPAGQAVGIYLYYGNASAATASDGANVFDDFEDFETPFSLPGVPLSNAVNPQTTPTYDGSGQVVHPSIQYFPGGWNGYSYWLAMTPYPNGNAVYENPSILASNDGSSWVVPDGLVNPIAESSNPGQGDVADPELYYDSSTNLLWTYYLDQNHPLATTYLNRKSSADGITWGPQQTCLTVTINTILSPAIVKIGETYYMWYVNLTNYSAGTTQVEYRTSTDGCTWTTPEIVNISLPGYYVWHLDVVFVQNEYRMLFAAYPNTSFGSGNTTQYYATSTNRLDWSVYTKTALGKGSNWDNGGIYRSTLLFDEANDLLRVWYSAHGSSGWHMGFTQGDYSDFLTYLSAPDEWTIQQGSGTWTRSTDQFKRGLYSGRLVQSTGTSMIVTKPQSTQNNFYQEWDLYDDMSSSAFKVVRIMNASNNKVGIGVWTGASPDHYAFHDKTYSYTTTSVPRSAGWHKFGILLKSDSSATFFVDNQPAGTLYGQFNNGALIDVEGYGPGATTYYVDDIRIRKYANPEPTVSHGAEEPPEPAAWYNSGWAYRRAVEISNPCSTILSNHEVLISIDTSGHALEDGSDIRVTDASGTNLIPFWIETWDSINLSGTIWVRVPTILVNGTSIYVYYGNSSITPPAPIETAPAGPFTRAAGNPIVPIGDTGNGASLLAENIVYDSVTAHYWLVFANYRSGSSVGLVWSDTPADPASWHWHSGNVVTEANAPHILYDNGYWYIFYADRAAGRWGDISVARSATIDGTYTFVADVLPRGAAGSWESYRVDEPYVFYRASDSKWVMIYMAETGSTDEQIGYATADALLGPYTKYAGNPCIAFGPSGSYDAGTIADPWVYLFNGTYYIGYAASSTNHSPWQTAYATTTDWITFTKVGLLPVLPPDSAGNTFRGAVTRVGDTYVLAYTGGGYNMRIATQPVYQNPPEDITSDPEAVFDFYDPFDGSSLDNTKWTTPVTTGTATVAGGQLTLTASSHIRINATQSFGMNYLVETRARHPQAGTPNRVSELGLIGADFNNTVRILDDFPLATDITNWMRHTANNASNTNYYRLPQLVDTNMHIFRVYRLSATPNISGFQIDNNTAVTDTLTTPTINLNPFLMSYGSGNQFVIDWIRVRKYCGIEPTITVNSEQSHPTAVELNYFRAARTPGGVLLTWETVNEASLAGFNLYRREVGGEFLRLNGELIPPNQGGQPEGSSYIYLDEDAQLDRRYEYRLEAIETTLETGSTALATFWPFDLLLPVVIH